MIRLVVYLATFSVLASYGVQAQPAREGNIWDGADHDPNPAIVHQKEKAAGVLPSPQEQQRLNNSVERTAKELLNQQPTTNAPGGSAQVNQGR
jgi:hypothetical protein